MATSGSANFATSRDELIKNAYLQLGVIGEGVTPSATQVTNASFMLNLITKAWHTDGMPLWAVKQTSFALTASNSYTIGTGQTVAVARPERIYSAFIRDTSQSPDTDISLTIYTRKDYDQISSKSSTGNPTVLYYDPQGAATAYGTIYLWPLPDTTSIANKTCYITYQRPYDDFDAASDEPDFPQSWYMAVLWRLMWALSPAAGIPMDERKTLFQESEFLHKTALENMEEGSIHFAPASR